MPAPVDKRNTFRDEVFTCFTSKDGKVFLYWHGRQVKTLKGEEASQFLVKMKGLDPQAAQLLMAKVTGNFKRGNERKT